MLNFCVSIPSRRKQTLIWKKNCFGFSKTMVRTFCATCAVTGYPCLFYGQVICVCVCVCVYVAGTCGVSIQHLCHSDHASAAVYVENVPIV